MESQEQIPSLPNQQLRTPSNPNPIPICGPETAGESMGGRFERLFALQEASTKAFQDMLNNDLKDKEANEKFEKSLIPWLEETERNLPITEKAILDLKQDEKDGKHVPKGEIEMMESEKSKIEVSIIIMTEMSKVLKCKTVKSMIDYLKDKNQGQGC